MSVRIVLVGTTHPGNIGAVARAMKNMGLNDLALVNPRYFPHEDATARASGATDILDSAKLCTDLKAALTDVVYAVGTSARSRSISWPTYNPRDCAGQLLQESEQGTVAVVFGPEKTGLHNDDLDLCHALLTIPTNPDFSSLNLAMAVQVLSYEIRIAGMASEGLRFDAEASPATGDEMEHLYSHLEQVMTDIGFLVPDNPRHLMRRLRRLFIRARPDKNEVNILRGLLSAVERNGKPPDGKV